MRLVEKRIMGQSQSTPPCGTVHWIVYGDCLVSTQRSELSFTCKSATEDIAALNFLYDIVSVENGMVVLEIDEKDVYDAEKRFPNFLNHDSVFLLVRKECTELSVLAHRLNALIEAQEGPFTLVRRYDCNRHNLVPDVWNGLINITMCCVHVRTPISPSLQADSMEDLLVPNLIEEGF